MRLIESLRAPGRAPFETVEVIRRSHRWLLASATLMCATMMAGCSSGNSTSPSTIANAGPVALIPDSPSLTNPSLATPGLPVPVDDPFYQAPPGYASTMPGMMLKSRPFTLSPAFKATWSSLGGYQLLYRTTDAHGSPTATVTTILLPTHPAPGPRNLVSDQIAEDSLTTSCAPSYLMRQAPTPSSVPDKVMIGTALANGWDVVVSDYEGPHSELLVGPLEGRETLDGIRAAEGFAGDGLKG